jgi:hypothetical protein
MDAVKAAGESHIGFQTMEIASIAVEDNEEKNERTDWFLPASHNSYAISVVAGFEDNLLFKGD